MELHERHPFLRAGKVKLANASATKVLPVPGGPWRTICLFSSRSALISSRKSPGSSKSLESEANVRGSTSGGSWLFGPIAQATD